MTSSTQSVSRSGMPSRSAGSAGPRRGDSFLLRLAVYVFILVLGSNFDLILDRFVTGDAPGGDKGDVLGAVLLALIMGALLVFLEVNIRRSLAHKQALAVSEQRFRALYDLAPIPYQSLDGEGRLIEVNNAWIEATGYAREEAVGRWFGDLLAPQQRDLFRERFLGFKASGEFRGVFFSLLRKDGAPLLAELHGRVHRDEQGRFHQVHCVFINVTERRRLEEQLLHAQKMEAMGRLAGGVAHDFNNLLTGILGYTDLLKMRLAGDDPSHREVNEILRAASRAAGLANQLLAFSRRQVLEPRVIDLNALLRDTNRMLRRVIGENVELVTLLSPGLGMVEMDPVQIEQVILNLAINARDAMPGGGVLTIRTANLHLERDEAGDLSAGEHVLLEVRDDGIGMSGELLARIFEPFFTTKGEGKGTGLGLSTVYGIVRQGGGRVAVESEEGKGSVFRVYLPRVQGVEAPAPEHASPALQAAGNETVLLVEDNEMVRSLSREVLVLHGYRVLEAGDGEEALRVLAADPRPLHLLLTDVVMPRMNGRELARRLLARQPGLRVLFMSGYTDEGLSLAEMKGPGRSFIQKPFMPQDLLLEVRGILDQPAECRTGGAR